MLYVCVRYIMAVVFSICIVTRGAVGGRVWEVSVSSCICCMFVSCVHPVCILWQFPMLNSAWLSVCQCCSRMQEVTIWKRHIPEAVSQLPNPVAVSAFIICSGVCTCTEML